MNIDGREFHRSQNGCRFKNILHLQIEEKHANLHFIEKKLQIVLWKLYYAQEF